MAYMYIVECSDGTYYTGSTMNLDRRLHEHNTGQGAIYTSNRLPVKLVYYEEYTSVADAFYREKQIQNWSRKKKEALINDRRGELPLLSKKEFKRY